MKRYLVAGAAAVAAGGAFFFNYSVVAAADGDGYLILGKDTAKECADGGGCVVLSQRKGNNLINYAAAMGAQAARHSQDKGV